MKIKQFISSTYKFCLLTILVLQVSLFSPAQSGETITDITSQFNNYQKQRFEEKLFVHTDKGFYVTGEIIWLKIYDVENEKYLPGNLSKLAYAELLDRNNKVILQGKISLNNGHGNGSFYLPVNTPSGNYTLRAYTSWMKNFSAEHFFQKNITVVNTRIANKTRETAGKNIQAAIFPEGGNLVLNIESKIAFKVTDESGKGVENYTGRLLDENNKVLQELNPYKFGMGSFLFTPAEGHRYRMEFIAADGRKTSSDLPQIYPVGAVIHLEKKNGHELGLSVQSTQSETKQVYLLIQSHKQLLSVKSQAVQNGKALFTIDPAGLGEGISTLTLLDQNKKPLCERLYFSQPHKQLLIAAQPDKNIYARRSKANLQISTTDETGSYIPSDVSLSVYRLDSLQTEEGIDISSYLWLGSELKGTVESAAWYFNKPDEEKEQALDNLLLTQGWRKFNWDAVWKQEKPAFQFLPEYNGHIITGRVVHTGTGEPGKKIAAYISAPGTKPVFSAIESDENGNLLFDVPDLVGTTNIIVQTNYKQDSLYRIDINSPFSNEFAQTTVPQFTETKSFAGTLNDLNINMQVQNIFTREQRNRVIASSIDTLPFFSPATTTYLLDNYTRFTTLEEVLLEYVTNIFVRKKNNVFATPLFDKLSNKYFESDPLVLLDGVPMFDMNKFMEYDPLKIRKLEMVNGRYFFGNTFFDGIMNWTTYKGELEGFELDPHAVAIDYEGLQLQREFYMPVYESAEQKNSHLPDFRTVLFWSPDILTGNTGKKQLAIYTSDLPGTYIAVLQGNTATGRSGSKTIQFEVK